MVSRNALGSILCLDVARCLMLNSSSVARHADGFIILHSDLELSLRIADIYTHTRAGNAVEGSNDQGTTVCFARH